MLKLQSKANIPTEFGEFCFMAFSDSPSDLMPLMVLMAKGTDLERVVNVRIHSECITGEIFHSKKCECAQQLESSMKYMCQNGGLVVYLRQEGRNIGIINKLKAYALQEEGINTIDANLKLGLPVDARKYDEALEVLRVLGVKKVNLLTNNPDKLNILKDTDIELISHIPLQVKPNEHNQSYLDVKKNLLGHTLE